MSPELLKRADDAIEYLLNGTGDPDEGPYVIGSPEQMEADHKWKLTTGGEVEWEDFDIELRVADDITHCTVHGFEGQAMWGTAYAIAGAGKLIHDLKAALVTTESERDAARQAFTALIERMDIDQVRARDAGLTFINIRAASGEPPTYEEIADAEELAAILHETIIKLSDRAAG